MTERVLGDDSTVLDLPWAAVFDPAANIRAVGAVQSQGLRAATELVDRFVTVFADGDATATSDTPTDATSSTPPTAAPDPRVDSLMSAWQTLMAKIMPGLTTPSGPAGGVATVDVLAGQASNALQLNGSAGAQAQAEVWLHNGGPDDLGEVSLRGSQLLSHTGHVIAAGRVAFDCRTVALAARSSRGMVVTVDVPSGTPAGVYRGTLLVENRSDLWLAVVLTVQAPDR